MSTVISPATGKLIKVGSKEFQDLMNNPLYRDYFTYPKASDLNARVTPLVPYVAPSTALPVVPSYGTLNSYSSGLSVSSNSFKPETNSFNSDQLLMTQKFGTNNRSSSNNVSVSNNVANNISGANAEPVSKSLPNSLIIPPQYPAEKINLASVSVPIQEVWPSLSKTSRYYHR